MKVFTPLAHWRGVGVEALQCLDTPQQEGNQHDVAELDDVFVGRATDAKHIEAKQEKNGRQHHEALPNLLVLQVGIVVTQPPSIFPQRTNHRYDESQPHRHYIAIYHRHQCIAAADATPHQSHDNRHHQQNGRP